MPLRYGPSCAPPVNGGAEDRRKRYGHSSAAAATRASAPVGAGPGERHRVRLQEAADRVASKHIDDSRNRGKAGALAMPPAARTVGDAERPDIGEQEVRGHVPGPHSLSFSCRHQTHDVATRRVPTAVALSGGHGIHVVTRLVTEPQRGWRPALHTRSTCRAQGRGPALPGRTGSAGRVQRPVSRGP